MFCGNCGSKVEDGDKFCAECGVCIIRRQNTQTESAQSATQAPSTKSDMSDGDTLAIAGFILAFFVPILGMILCKLALGKNIKNVTLAKAGFIIGIVEIVLSVVVGIIMGIVVGLSGMSYINDYYSLCL